MALLIADVVGHGASAAMLTSLVKSAFRASYPDYDPRTVVERVAETFASFEPGLFVTLLCARISAPASRLEYVNAGHSGGLLAVPGSPAIPLATTGPLVSPILRDATWQLGALDWLAEARLLVYTDGSTETWGRGAQLLETNRRRAAADAAVGSGVAGSQLLAQVRRAVERFAGGRPSDDDMTLLTARQIA